MRVIKIAVILVIIDEQDVSLYSLIIDKALADSIIR